jgi:hypothetical protein
MCKVPGQPYTDHSIFFFPFHQTLYKLFLCQANWPSSNADSFHLDIFVLNFSQGLAILNQVLALKSSVK